MTASLPDFVRTTFSSFITTEYTTIDSSGAPITWPVTPYYRDGDAVISVTTGLGYPKKANDARANSNVALLFSDPTGSGIQSPPAMVLVQGTADVDSRNLEANRARYAVESAEKLPAATKSLPPAPIQRMMSWYFTRVYVHVRPERVYVWRTMDAEPEVFGSHVEEQRSGHNEEPETGHAPPEGGSVAWDARIEELGERYESAVLSVVGPDGFPFSLRTPVRCDREARLIHFDELPVGTPADAGPACLTAHAHDDAFTWQVNFQVRGDLVATGDGWALSPHRLVGGFELPPTSALGRIRINYRKVRRFRKIAKRELERLA